jgi:hypothetical protein
LRLISLRIYYAMLQSAHMAIETQGNGQGDKPEVPQTSDQQQPDQAVLKRREYQRKQYQQNPTPILEKNRRWRQQNPDKARESNRKWAEKHPEKAAEASRRTSLRYFNKNRQQLYEQRRAQYKQKREAASRQAEQQAAEQGGNLPRLHPIFDQLSKALATQQTPERQRRTRRRKNP